MNRGPKPRVEYGGRTYTTRKWSVEIPDLYAMDSLAALVWLNQNTIPTGTGIRTASAPNLRGLNLVTN
ncbi:Uncharacterised protein [Mycobacteroides abscessus subsp. abscessus]|nr:Uncharacterised protein [Mycobacteroides abscessus subsp. abscessus]SIC58899.1 Uncharacterised protein [Mycobacteroides abscessus subsp. abscessus]SKO59644.1 Uncharacterised protein [Mycobacteroides abscessus subsp. abscessus]